MLHLTDYTSFHADVEPTPAWIFYVIVGILVAFMAAAVASNRPGPTTNTRTVITILGMTATVVGFIAIIIGASSYTGGAFNERATGVREWLSDGYDITVTQDRAKELVQTAERGTESFTVSQDGAAIDIRISDIGQYEYIVLAVDSDGKATPLAPSN